MSASPAPSGTAAQSRAVEVRHGEVRAGVELIERAGRVVRVRTAYLFEVGEALELHLDGADGRVTGRAWVRAHVGPPEAQITELVLEDAGEGGG